MESHELPTKSRDEYRQLAHIGRGAFGDVFLCEHTETGERVCMKEVDVTFMLPLERSRCLNEVKVLQQLPAHSNIVGFRDAFWDQVDEASEKLLVLILEYADVGDLGQYLRSLESFQMKDDEIRRIFRQVAQGVCHLHSHRVVHRDLKCGNVFLSRSGHVVIGDFGTSKLLPSSSRSAHELEAQDLTSTVVGSPLYMSPEQLEGEPHGFATDIWSLGCVLYELFSGGKPAFTAPSYPAVIYRITSGNYDLLDPALVSVDANNLIASLLQKSPQKRPTILEILKSPWLQMEDDVTTLIKVESESLELTAATPIPERREATMTASNPNTNVATSDLVLPPPVPVCMASKSLLRPRKQHKTDLNRAISPLILCHFRLEAQVSARHVALVDGNDSRSSSATKSLFFNLQGRREPNQVISMRLTRSIVAQYECDEDEVPNTLYRISYTGSPSLDARARPSFRTPQEFKTEVENHLDWYNRTLTPFVSVFANRRHAWNWANLLVGRHEKMDFFEIDGAKLRHVFRVKHLIKHLGVRTHLPESMYEDEYLVLRGIPERSIIADRENLTGAYSSEEESCASLSDDSSSNNYSNSNNNSCSSDEDDGISGFFGAITITSATQ